MMTAKKKVHSVVRDERRLCRAARNFVVAGYRIVDEINTGRTGRLNDEPTNAASADAGSRKEYAMAAAVSRLICAISRNAFLFSGKSTWGAHARELEGKNNSGIV
jgi:hypothetical protein